MNIDALNKKFKSLDFSERLPALFAEFSEKDIFVTSSFGATAGVLLHLMSKVKPNHPIYTIDTGYLFKETQEYVKTLQALWHLNIKFISAEKQKHDFTKEHKTYEFNKDLCCEINKVIPLQKVKAQHKIWISGLLSFQNVNRKNKDIFENKNGIIKCYPIIDLPEDLVNTYKIINEIPNHPLTHEGYDSIGCTHCTQKGQGRTGRWAGMDKTECGIHT